MTRKSLMEKSLGVPKFAVRHRNRCTLCGRPRGYMRLFKMCRLCFRHYASFGFLTGVKKTSW